MTFIEKIRAILVSTLYLLILATKGLIAKILYPLVYPTRNWCRLRVYNYENIELKKESGAYETIEVSKPTYMIAKFLWYFFDDGVIPQGGTFFIEESDHCNGNIGKVNKSQEGWEDTGELSDLDENICDKWRAFWCAYRWNALRNPMYNVNYSLLSNHSPIVWMSGYENVPIYRRKLRRRNGDLGTRMIWYKTEKGQNRYLFSLAKILFGKYDWTFYMGWNADDTGRFTFANKFHKIG